MKPDVTVADEGVSEAWQRKNEEKIRKRKMKV